MTDDDVELLRRRLTEQVSEAVEKDLKRQYAWLGFVALAVTSGALVALVMQALSTAQVELAAAKTVQQQVTSRLSEAAETVETSARAIQAMEQTAESVDGRITALVNRANTGSDLNTQGFRISETLRDDLAQLSGVVMELAQRQDESDSTIRDLASQAGSLVAGLSDTAGRISYEADRAAKSRYPVRVYGASDVAGFQDGLGQLGFTVASVDDPSFEGQPVAVAVIPSRLPVGSAQQLIGQVRAYWPDDFQYVIVLDGGDEFATVDLLPEVVLEDLTGETVTKALSEGDFTKILGDWPSRAEFYEFLQDFGSLE